MRALVFCVFLLIHSVASAEKAPMLGAKHFELPSWFKPSFLDIGEDVTEAAESNKRVLLFFHQAACPYCEKFINTNFAIPEVKAYTQQHFDVIDINLWGDREVSGTQALGIEAATTEKKFSAALKVWATPTLLFLNESSEVVLRLNGYYDPQKFMIAMRYVAEKQETKQSLQQFYESQMQTKPQGKLIAQSFFAPPPYTLNAVKKPLAVLLEEPNSAASKRLHEEVLNRPETQKHLQAYHVVQLNRWSDTTLTAPDGSQQTAKSWTEILQPKALPALILFDEGKEIVRLDAMFKAYHVQSLLDYVSSGAYKTEPNIQRYLHERSEKLREQGITVDMWR